MNPRERTIATALLAAVGLAAGAFLFYEFYLVPVGERQDEIRKAAAQVKEKNDHIQAVADEMRKVAEWSKLSLPSGATSSERMYEQHLHKLIRASDITTGSWIVKSNTTPEFAMGPGLTKKAPFITPLTFSVTGHTDLSHVLRLLANFYSTPLLHRITKFSIARPKNGPEHKTNAMAHRSEDLYVQLEVEAIIVQGAGNRDDILPKLPAPQNLARPLSEYSAMIDKNIFYGPPPPALAADDGPDPTKEIQFTGITHHQEDGGFHEVTLVDLSDNKMWYLYPDRTRDTKNIFEIKNKAGQVCVLGEVTRVDGPEVIFRAGDKHYSIRLGQTLAEAMRKPLSEAQVQVLHLPGPAKNGGR